MIASIDLGDVLWSLLALYVIVHLLIATGVVIFDVMRSHDLRGVTKALWLLALLVVPVVTVLVYMVVRGDGIGERRMSEAPSPPAPPASASATRELETGANLYDRGVLSKDELSALKRRILDA